MAKQIKPVKLTSIWSLVLALVAPLLTQLPDNGLRKQWNEGWSKWVLTAHVGNPDEAFGS